MASLALGLAGAGIAGGMVSGGIIASSYFGMSTIGIGWSLGSMAGSYLFGPDMPDMQGPRMSDKAVQGSAYGMFIPLTYGSMRLAGNVIWATDLIEVAKEEEVSGGKGGGGGGSYTTYTYFANFAVLLCEGEVDAIRKVWADGKLIYNASPDNDAWTGESSGIRLYRGDETQLPDPLIESYEGAGQTPAYRGRCYVVFERFALADYGNRIPNLTFEVVRGASELNPVTYDNDDTPDNHCAFRCVDAVDLDGNRSWQIGSYDNGGSYNQDWLECRSIIDGTVIYYTEPQNDTWATTYISEWTNYSGASKVHGNICYVGSTNELWICKTASDHIQIFDADTGGLKERIPAVTSFCDSLVWDPTTDTVISNPSGYGGQSTWHFWDVGSRNHNGSLNMQYFDNYYIFCHNGLMYVSCTTIYQRVLVIDVNSRTVLSDIALDANLRNSLMDTSRNRMVHFSQASSASTMTAYTQDMTSFAITGTYTINLLVDPTYGEIDWGLVLCRPAWDAKSDLYVSTQANSPLYSRNYLNPNTWTMEYGETKNNEQYTGGICMATQYQWVLATANSVSGHHVAHVPYGQVVYASTTTLEVIVQDICTRAGLDLSDIDTSEMTEEVHGYIITQQAPARSALEPLLLTYYYDAVESS